MTFAPRTSRDVTLDILKGIGCLFMIVAHSSLNFGGYERFKFWYGLAPVLFFSAAGVTAALQAQKYKPRGVLLTYAFLLLLGYSFNRITDPGFLKEIEFDIIQMIAVGSSVIYLVERYARPPAWIYFLLGLLAFGMKFLLQALFSGFAVVGLTNLIFPPGIFPIFPWLFLFFFGLFAYRNNNAVNLAAALGSGLLLLVLQQTNFPLDIENKWDMSIGYFLVSCILLFGTFYLLRLIPFPPHPRGLGLLTFLGQNSLLFLYVHFPIILYFKEIHIQNIYTVIFEHPYLFWVLTLALTVIVMVILLWLPRSKALTALFSQLPVWLVLVFLVFAVGIYIRNRFFTYYIEIGLGLLIALFYPRLANLLKQRSSQNTSPS